MKSLSLLASLAAFAANAVAHYNFPQLIVSGVTSGMWQYVRETNNWQDYNPLTDVTSTDVRCYSSAESGTSNTTSVNAGSTITFTVSGNPPSTYHPGVLNVYMAKAPSGTDVSKWDGSGTVWFKIQQIPAIADGVTITFPSQNMTTIPVTIPSQTPSGQYLVRVEHIALHSASSYGGAQFYIACAQVTVTNGGTGTPGPLVAFPGAYTGNEPGILINIYYPIPTTYIQPGPSVWPATSGGGSPSGPTTTVKTTSTPTSSPTKSSSSSPPTSTGTVPQYGQCGGQGYTGATVCVAPFTCKVTNQYYSQCL